MQQLGVNFGGMWKVELGFSIWVFLFFFLLKKSGLILKSPVATLPPIQEAYAMCSLRITCNAIIYPS